MTTIVFRGGVFAADSQINNGGFIEGYCEKIVKVGDKYIGSAGPFIACTEFEKFMRGEEFDKEVFKGEYGKGFEALVVDAASKKVSTYTSLTEEVFTADFYALGSGCMLAKGAMLMGANAEQAVEQAIKLDTRSGGKIQVIKVW